MDNVGEKSDCGQHFENCAGEKGKTLGVVIISVKPVAFEIILIIDKIIGDVALLGLEDTAILPPPGNGNDNACDNVIFSLYLSAMSS